MVERMPGRARARARRGAVVGLALAVAAALLPGIVAPAEPAVAASAADWDPGYIISDENFYDGGALDADGVTLFIATKNPGCLPGATCLLNYRQNTPTMPANQYCSHLPGIANESAASIIARVGAACRISQRTLLVLLQKEQSLITTRAATEYQLTKATGFSCPDTAPCDPAFAGFFYQVYYAARQFQVYRANPNSFNYKPGRWNSILYHPNRACGSSSVYIHNDATAALYIYTPYQPNAKALEHLYETGDDCSSYGNRNFWRMWTDWFGPPTQPPLSLVRETGTSEVFLVGLGIRYRFPSADMLAQYSQFGPVRDISSDEMGNYYFDGRLVQHAIRSTDGNVYLIDHWRFAFTSCEQVAAHGMTCDTLPTASTTQLKNVPYGGQLQHVVLLSDGTQWLIQNATRRQVLDLGLLPPYGIPAAVTGVSSRSVGHLPIASPVLGPGLYTDGAGAYRVVGGGGWGIPPDLLAPELTATARVLHPQSLGFVTSTPLPSRATADGRSVLLTNRGWLEVDAARLGASNFPAAPSGITSGLPRHAPGGPVLVQERGSSTTYLLTRNGLLEITREARDWYVERAGVPATPFVVPAGALAGLTRTLETPLEIGPGVGQSPR